MKGNVSVFKLPELSVEDIFKKNVAHSFDIIQNKGQSFHPTVFVITDKALYYCALDTDLAERTQTSPNDQIIGLLEQFRKHKDEFGDIQAYQVIGEAWMKSFTKDTDVSGLRHGDLEKMPSRMEVITSISIRKGKRRRFQTWEIVRAEPEIEDSKVIEFKVKKFDSWESDKFPEIPKARSEWSGKL